MGWWGGGAGTRAVRDIDLEMGSSVYVTTAIAQFMRELERAWDAHRDALLVRRDLAAALAPLAAEPSVVHIPAMTGAAGRPALERFYADQFLPHVPGDLALRTISRTVDRWRDGYWPSSQRPGAMSSRASVGPQEPGAYDAIGGGLDSSGSTTFHAAASPSGRVYSERSPISASWISRT